MPPGIDYLALRQSIQKPGHEGRSRNVGYVPSDKNNVPIDNSGVTIGVGFDLGMHNDWELKQMGFSKKIRKKLAPYLGKKGKDAQKIASNLRVTGDDYIDIITRPINYKINKIANKYNSVAGNNAFQSLEPEIQKVIFGTIYQMGIEGRTGAPDFWKQATSKDWTGILENLEGSDWGRYSERRSKQAKDLWESGAVLRQSVIDEDKRGKLFE